MLGYFKNLWKLKDKFIFVEKKLLKANAYVYNNNSKKEGEEMEL